MSSVKVTKVETHRYGTTLTAPGHNFATGAQILVEGVSGLEEDTFIVDDVVGSKFSILRNICVDIASMDPDTSIVQTTCPHRIGNSAACVVLQAFDTVAQVHVRHIYEIGEIVDDRSLRLGFWCDVSRVVLPASLSASLSRGTLSCERCSVVVERSGSAVPGVATLVIRPHRSKDSCLRDWRCGLCARAIDVPGATQLLRPATPDISLLHVGQAGWNQCNGIFHRSTKGFQNGPLLSIVYSEELSMWCLLADVLPLHPLLCQRRALNLPDWDGPQLLYVRRGPLGLLGRWEPVIGPAPGPLVEVYKETRIVQASSNQLSPILDPTLGSSVLDLLLNYTEADWRGGLCHGSVWGLSPLEAMLLALELWSQMNACAAVCRHWQEALKPHRSLKQICWHALQLPPELGPNLPVPPILAAVIAIATFTSLWREQHLVMQKFSQPAFRRYVWPARVSRIELASELPSDEDGSLDGPTAAVLNRYAGVFSSLLQQVLKDLPLPWTTTPGTAGVAADGDGHRFACCDLLDGFAEQEGPVGFLGMDSDGAIELWSSEGVKLLPHADSVLQTLASSGLNPVSRSYGWLCHRVEPPRGLPETELSFMCPTCAEGKRCLGASQVAGANKLELRDPAGTKIELQIEVTLLPFFATSKDPSLVHKLLPFLLMSVDSSLQPLLQQLVGELEALSLPSHQKNSDSDTSSEGQVAFSESREYLSRYPNTLLFTSHSEDFMNGVCTNIMQLTQKGTLVVWGGNYDQYIKTRTEVEKNQMTKYKKEQDDIKHLQEFIRSCGTYANLRVQAESKQKIIDKMVEAGLTEKPMPDPTYEFSFPDSEKISPPVMAFAGVSFSYSGKKEDHLYEKLELGVDLDSRIALVGPNGAGKSTLLKLMLQQIEPTEGEVKRSGKLRIGHYNQHSEAVLDLEASPLQFLKDLYPEGIVTTSGKKKMEDPEWRGKLGSFGITGDFQTRKMKTMSDGYRTRMVMLLMALVNPHVLLLDEPTNHLDMQCIDALAGAINKFSGGVVLVSHDFRLISQVAKEIWVCDKKTVSKWEGDIQSYKKHLKKEVMKKFKA
ncbi:abcF2 [Symbiodinium microadriaticum]|nr:abcF2 [Symbiodinium microadriaticum]